jgi:hypothetical protein
VTAAETPAYLATAPVLLRSADIITYHGHTKGDFVTSDGYCAAGAIGEACGINPDDWDDNAQFVHLAGDSDDYATAYRNWREGRAASLAALRALAHRLAPDAAVNILSRSQLVEIVSGWNDHDEDADADHVVAELRAAARQAVQA